MKVLFLTQVLPYPPDSGPKVKAWHTLRYLAERGDEVTLVSFVRGRKEAAIAELRRLCARVEAVPIERPMWRELVALGQSFLTREPWMMRRDERAVMHALLEQLVAHGNYDLVHADQMNMAQYALPLAVPAKVLDTHNALWLLYKRLTSILPRSAYRLLLERDWRLLRRYEGRMVRRFDGVIAVSEPDRRALEEAAGEAVPMTIIPIAVDAERYPMRAAQPQGARLLYVGTMYWPPNIDGVLWFTREVLPRIRRVRPDVRFEIIGARPPETVRALDDGESVRVLGYVDDLTPYFEQAAVMVVPLRVGSGMRVKILEGLARGIPMVSTTIGCEGIEAEDGREILLADEAASFAEAVLRLLDDPQAARQVAERGRALLERRYDFRVACRPLDALYAGLKEGDDGR